MLKYSREVNETLNKDKLLSISRRGYTWSRTITIEVSKKKCVSVRVFLLPSVSRGEAEHAVLHVTAEANPSLVKECGQNCWVVVETKVMDQQTAAVAVSNITPHKIKDERGKVAFCQDLVSCEDVRAWSGRHVNLVLSATFVTCPLDRYFSQDCAEFCVIRHKSEALGEDKENNNCDHTFTQLLKTLV